MKYNIVIPEIIDQIAEEIKKQCGKIYIVGGYIRDCILNIESKDIDFEIFGLKMEKAENILAKFGKVKKVGETFPILLMGNYEFSIIEEEFSLERVKKEAERRDFTINALYFDVENKTLFDFVNAETSFEKKVLLPVSERIMKEDPVRILRAAQIALRIGFEISDEIKIIAKNDFKLLITVPKERIFIEIEKILMKCQRPSQAFIWLKEIGWLELFYPELVILEKVEQGIKFHPEGDAFIHTMLAIDALPIEERELDIMFALLFHDVGKAIVKNIREDDTVHFYGHDEAGAAMVEVLMRRITDNKKLIESVEKLIRYHMYPLKFLKEITPKSIKKISIKVDFPKLMKVHYADMNGKGKSYCRYEHIDKAMEIYKAVKNEIRPIISGKMLISIGIEPGENMGMILKELYEMQLDEQFITAEDGIEIAKNLLKSKEEQCRK